MAVLSAPLFFSAVAIICGNVCATQMTDPGFCHEIGSAIQNQNAFENTNLVSAALTEPEKKQTPACATTDWATHLAISREIEFSHAEIECMHDQSIEDQLACLHKGLIKKYSASFSAKSFLKGLATATNHTGKEFFEKKDAPRFLIYSHFEKHLSLEKKFTLSESLNYLDRQIASKKEAEHE